MFGVWSNDHKQVMQEVDAHILTKILKIITLLMSIVMCGGVLGYIWLFVEHRSECHQPTPELGFAGIFIIYGTIIAKIVEKYIRKKYKIRVPRTNYFHKATDLITYTWFVVLVTWSWEDCNATVDKYNRIYTTTLIVITAIMYTYVFIYGKFISKFIQKRLGELALHV